MAVKEFKRYERKYLITKEQVDMLLERIGDRIVPDSYCKDNNKYHIYNIYFDTENNDIIRHSCEKPYFKEKLRFRAYNNFYETGNAFLEIKRKIGKMVIKRRIDIGIEALNNFIFNGIKPKCKDMQKVNEFAYYLSLYNLKPAVYIAYDRIAYNLIEDPQVRITFDTNIRTRRDRLSFNSGTDGEVLLNENYAVLEIKFPFSTPFWLSKELSSLGIFPHGYSKYGEEYKLTFNKRLLRESV
ncbi:MAG TPA: molecular chaperone [Clostridiales bacterium]|nr:MAG: hypothetical protein A2Y40_06275 [Candidatus Margulisbacteria bacterium GWF2_35_9]HAN20717.1 molecular chaperone [Clostridiales bacterium]